ncbi:MAG: TonB-dependent receptor [Deltaproteobacteria bacterium]|nr:TonB-dependent receptor [Deltaproteobacteria bacterium]
MRGGQSIIAICLLGQFVAIAAAVADQPGLNGVVRDVDRGTEIWGALVTLKPSGQTTVTDRTGRFTFEEIRKGRYKIEVSLSGYDPVTLDVICPRTEIEIWLIASGQNTDHEEIIITSKREKRASAGRAEVSVHLLPKEVILESAGALEDPVRIVATLPGVLPLSEITPLFFVRGGAAYESFFYLDDALIYNPFQLGGAATIFNPSLIDDMKFYAGGHGVEYPGSLSGVLDIRYRDPLEDGLHGNAELSVISTNLDLEGPTFGNGPTFIVSFRRSNFEVPMAIAKKAGWVSDKFAAPAFWDIYAQLHQRLGRQHHLTLSGLVIKDGVELIEFEPEDVGGFGAGTFFYKNLTYAVNLRYRGQYGSDVLHTAVFSSVSNQIDAEATGDNPLAVDSRIHSFTLRSDWLVKLGDQNSFFFGLFGNRTQADILANSPDIRRFIMGLRIGGDLNLENLDFDISFPFFMAGFYVKTSWGFLSDRVVIEPGLRVSYAKPSYEVLVEPRAAVRIRLATGLETRLAAGLYAQPVLNPLAVEPEIGAARLSAERAIHLIGGLDWKPNQEWRLRVEGFIKYYDHLVTNTDDVGGYLSGRVEPFTNEGTGGAYGGELFIEKQGRTWAGWLSYSYLKAWRHNPRMENEFANAADLNPGQDVPHTLALVLFYRPTRNWKFSTRIMAHSGSRYTPLDPDDPYRIETDANDQQPVWRINPDYSRLNGVRAPFYFKIDLRGSYTWFFSSWHLEVYLELMNAQYRKNVILYRANQGRPAEKQPTHGPVFELPIIPFIGVRGGF